MVNGDPLSSNENFNRDDFDSPILNGGESKSNITRKASRFFRKASND